MSGVRIFSFILLLAGLVIGAPEAMAQTKLGAVIDTTRDSWGMFPNVLSVFAYIAGAFFAVSGIFKFKDHVDSPLHHHISAGVKRFLAGGSMFALPYFANSLHTTLATGESISGTAGHAAAAGDGMDAMIQKLIGNIYLPAINMLSAFAYIAAILLMIMGIVRLTKTAQEGHRGPTGLGTIMTFLTSAGLFAFGDMIAAFSSSIFGGTVVKRYAEISSTVISNAADRAKIGTVVESLMAFVMIVGFIAFLRGWFVLRAFAEGQGNATIAQSLTLLFGGAVAINLGPFINILQTTVGVNGITFS